MNFKIDRLFSGENYRGTKRYLSIQKKYEIGRTILYFSISFLLFIAGWVATGSRINVLTIVAVLGCLPASKSAVEMIMFLRFQGCSEDNMQQIEGHSEGLTGLYDMVYTSYEKNYVIAHMTVKGNTICGFSQDQNFQEQDFYKHIDGILKTDRFHDVNVKVFTDIRKYTDRLDQLTSLAADEKNTEGIVATLKSVAL